ncbi:MAG TPA: hypothetical protein VEC16_06520 [Alphaproteobacteria bacterium]|nr:hypothetical protein [Alphaproteobacteria bacterium]
MNKLLMVLSLIFSAGLLVAGCSNAPTDTPNVPETPDVPAENAEDSGSAANENPTDGTASTTGEVIVAETKNAADVHDETLAAVADGTYVENVNYMSPGGMDTIEITVVVENDIVTDAEIKPVVADPKSQTFIAKVNAALPDLVIGKKITELDLPEQISGSSLTSAAFAKQIEDIIAENPA